MNIFKKYEAIGVFLSVAVMVVALSVVRFKSDTFALSPATKGNTQSAVIAVSQDKRTADVTLEANLKDAFTANGKLADLVIDDVRLGEGREVKSGDAVSVHYIGTTQDGVRFDNSYERGEPFEFTVGDGKVIEGWEKGLIGMKVGGQRILVIPSRMAYGNRKVGPIPPDSPLVFTIELMEIK